MSAPTETKGNSDQTNTYILDQILKGEYIKPVYQPIVSLTDGTIYGYEALSRISNEELQMNIEQMFRLADRVNKSWELEALCRTKALENASSQGLDKNLFLNVNSNIIHDEAFKKGFTKKRLEKYGLDASKIIFEITERVAILDSNAFSGSINHYKNQSYGIAIDDFGAGYSGLNVIASVRPNLIKLDMHLVRDIDKDEIKQLLCKTMVNFGRSAGIQLIAEGIETDEELRTLIKLKVDYGQGYFLGIPQEMLKNIGPEKVELIKKYHSRQYVENVRSSVYPIIGHLAKPGYTFSPEEKAGNIYETLRHNPTITEFAIINNDVTEGFMVRADIYEMFGGRYGHSLYSRKAIKDLIKTDFMRVNFKMTVDQVSRLAMQRTLDQLYNPIVVEKDNKYLGVVTIKDLLNACTQVEIDRAMHSNPLTGLPGNLLIEKEILSRIVGDDPYCITYYDIDNFKAYNDAYGFNNGDKMLALVADILRDCADNNEFIGHIGGDDFIVICDYHEGENYCNKVVDRFAAGVLTLYREQDVESGYIVSKNRHGVTENFPIASLSIAGISNRTNTYRRISDFSNDISQLKKKCKMMLGNYIEII